MRNFHQLIFDIKGTLYINTKQNYRLCFIIRYIIKAMSHDRNQSTFYQESTFYDMKYFLTNEHTMEIQ